MDVVRYFQTIVDRLLDGDLSAVASYYIHPLVIYATDGIRIEKTPEDTIHALAERLMSVKAAGTENIVVRLDDAGPIQNDRQPYDVTWSFLDRHGRQIGVSQLRYFCRTHDGEMRIELIDIMRSFRSSSLPAANAVNH